MAPKLAPQNGGPIIFYFVWGVWKAAFLVNQVGDSESDIHFFCDHPFPKMALKMDPQIDSQFGRLCCEKVKLFVT